MSPAVVPVWVDSFAFLIRGLPHTRLTQKQKTDPSVDCFFPKVTLNNFLNGASCALCEMEDMFLSKCAELYVSYGMQSFLAIQPVSIPCSLSLFSMS